MKLIEDHPIIENVEYNINLQILHNMRRTRTDDYINIERATDLEWVVFDKRYLKRANKKKATRRNRRYKNNLMNYLVKKIN